MSGVRLLYDVISDVINCRDRFGLKSSKSVGEGVNHTFSLPNHTYHTFSKPYLPTSGRCARASSKPYLPTQKPVALTYPTRRPRLIQRRAFAYPESSKILPVFLYKTRLQGGLIIFESCRGLGLPQRLSATRWTPNPREAAEMNSPASN